MAWKCWGAAAGAQLMALDWAIHSLVLTAAFMCFPVPNPCKQVCSHLCLLRPGGYSCACPQGSNFLKGSTTECDAGRGTAWAAKVAFRDLKNPCVLGPFSVEWGWLKGGTRDTGSINSE